MTFTDEQKTCIDCGDSFTDRAKDKQFRVDKGWLDATGKPSELKRCANCRKIRKEKQLAQTEQSEGGDYDRKPRKFYK